MRNDDGRQGCRGSKYGASTGLPGIKPSQRENALRRWLIPQTSGQLSEHEDTIHAIGLCQLEWH